MIARVHTAIRLLFTLFLTVGAAHASPSEDALDHVTEAIAAVDERGGRCRRDVLDDLLAVRDLLRDHSERRAFSRLRDVRRNADRCPDRIDRALRRAADALDDALSRGRDREHDRDRDRDRDRELDREREKPAKPKRVAGVPYADWGLPCAEHWVAVDLSRGRMNKKDWTAFAEMFDPICNGKAMGEAFYPNGTRAKSRDNDFYYPNGTKARSGRGEFYYPNGTKARSMDGDYYYPNGNTAWSSSNKSWYYKNGTKAGAAAALEAWALKRVSPEQRAAYELAMKSDVGLWRSVALLRLATQAR